MSNHNIERRLMRRIVDGLAGWTTYHQAGHPDAHYDEHLFYEPIRAIAEGRGWTAKQQQSIRKQAKGSGGTESIDFVIFRNSKSASKKTKVVFMEVKYVRANNIAQDITYLRSDIDKLRPLNCDELACTSLLQHCGKPSKFLLVIAREDALCKCVKSTSKKNFGVVKLLKRAHTQKVRGIYRIKAASHLKSDHQWQVIAIGESRWPK